MASKLYGWDVRNIAKISPKMVKKGHFWTSEGKRPKPTPLPHMRLWFGLRSKQSGGRHIDHFAAKMFIKFMMKVSERRRNSQ